MSNDPGVTLQLCPAHCWHPQPWLHTIYVVAGVHVDERCCWCGAERCENVVLPYEQERHGPHRGFTDLEIRDGAVTRPVQSYTEAHAPRPKKAPKPIKARRVTKGGRGADPEKTRWLRSLRCLCF